LEKKRILLLATALLLLTATFPISSAQSSTKDLGIIPKQQRKDTYMLCLGNGFKGIPPYPSYWREGCNLTGPYAWDAPHKDGDSPHGSAYCVRACISMIASFYGGNLSQDRISYYIFEEANTSWKDGLPEEDLGHIMSVPGTLISEVLLWALNGANVTYIESKPSLTQIKQWIDEGRPILRTHKYDHTGHATVIDGYTDDQIHVIDPWTANESLISYDALNVTEVWVPPSNATARSDEPTIWKDSDNDGVVDFDEQVRFHTNPYNPDSDGDGISDKVEIRSYTYLSNDTFDTYDIRKPDADNDTLRAELDWDSDNGGTPDGMEDLNHNGKIDSGETDPFDPTDDPYIPMPVALFDYSPEKPWATETVTFNATASYSPRGSITSYQWNFNDGNVTTMTLPTINHTYALPRNYTVTLKVTDNNTLWNTTTKTVAVYYRTDLNKDGTVNIIDIAIVARAYGTKPGDKNWNPIADVAEPYGEINIIDVARVAKDYGKTA